MNLVRRPTTTRCVRCLAFSPFHGGRHALRSNKIALVLQQLKDDVSADLPDAEKGWKREAEVFVSTKSIHEETAQEGECSG